MERGVSFLEVACAGSVEGYFTEVQGGRFQYRMFFFVCHFASTILMRWIGGCRFPRMVSCGVVRVA